MITFDEAQILAWISPLIWPFLRALAMFTALPVLGSRTVPARVRIALAAFIALAAQASLPPMPVVALDSPLAFTAVEFAGEIIGLQMGLNFAGFFDPLSASTATATSRFFGTLVAWLFIAINGHMLVVMALVHSFSAFPVGPEPFAFVRTMLPHQWGAEVFSTGLWIALPLVTLLLFVNLVLGAISRVAAQINIFAIGFPVTLGMGLLGMLLMLPWLQQPFTMVLERLLENFR